MMKNGKKKVIFTVCWRILIILPKPVQTTKINRLFHTLTCSPPLPCNIHREGAGTTLRPSQACTDFLGDREV